MNLFEKRKSPPGNRAFDGAPANGSEGQLQKIIRPAALRAGINKRIGWHTFRHAFSTLLIANGENVKVTQELMRHASSRCTLEVYSQARIIAKRQAQHCVIQMIPPKEADTPEPLFACGLQIDIR